MNAHHKPSRTRRPGLVSLSSRAFGHLAGVSCTSALIGLAMLGGVAPEALAASFEPQLLRHGVRGVVLHIGISACAWAFVCIVVRIFLVRREERRAVRLSAGSVTVETLIVFPFVLLMISGLAQLTLLNVAGLLSNLAGYNAGRAVWVWDAQGVDDTECQNRAVDAAAHAVAPSIPSDFVGAGGTRDADRTNFAAAFDTSGDVEGRATGKLSFARQSVRIRVVRGAEVGAEMTYYFHVAFPWFNYMFGEPAVIGGRTGYYSPIRRNYTLPRQPS